MNSERVGGCGRRDGPVTASDEGETRGGGGGGGGGLLGMIGGGSVAKVGSWSGRLKLVDRSWEGRRLEQGGEVLLLMMIDDADGLS